MNPYGTSSGFRDDVAVGSLRVKKTLVQPGMERAPSGGVREPIWRSKAVLVLGFVGLMVAGVIVSFVGRGLIDRYGGPAAFAVILGGPPILVLCVIGLRQGIAKYRIFRQQMTWWHWLWLLMVASNFVFRTRDFESAQQEPLDIAAIYRIGLVGIIALTLTVRLVLKRPDWLYSMFSGLTGIMGAFGLVCLLTTLWSVNPPWTLYKSLEYLVDIALISAIVANITSIESFDSLLDWTWIIVGGLVLSAWIEAPIWPQEALEGFGYMGGPLHYRLSGVYPGQGYNMLGTFGAYLGTIAICRLLPVRGRSYSRSWYWMVLGLGIITMIFAQTRSAIGGFVIGVALAFVFARRLGFGLLLGAASVVGIIVTGFSGLLLDFLARGQTQDQITSLSARVDWWSVAWEAFKLQPFHGYGAFAAAMVVFPKLGVKEITPLHSDYVEALVGTGIWGPLLIIASLIGAWWVLVRQIRRAPAGSLEYQLTVEAIAMLGILTVRSAVMGVVASHPPYQYLAVLGYAEFLRRRYRQASTSAVPDGRERSPAAQVITDNGKGSFWSRIDL